MRAAIRVQHAALWICTKLACPILVANAFKWNSLFKIHLMWNHMRSIDPLQHIGPAIHKASERLHIVGRIAQLNSFAFNPLHAIFGGRQIL